MLDIVYVYNASNQFCLFSEMSLLFILFTCSTWEHLTKAPYAVYNKGIRKCTVKTSCTVRLELLTFKMFVCYDKRLKLSKDILS